RDFHVTGVQTCALPIMRPASRWWSSWGRTARRERATRACTRRSGHREARIGVAVAEAHRGGRWDRAASALAWGAQRCEACCPPRPRLRPPLPREPEPPPLPPGNRLGIAALHAHRGPARTARRFPGFP